MPSNCRSLDWIALAPSVLWSFIGLPDELKYAFSRWNSMTHGNITFTLFLFSMRYASILHGAPL